MHKCDSCGKVVVNEKEYLCPHCGAVARKKCDHSTHLPDDKYNRANDYRTSATEHKSKTYDYQKAPKTDISQKFDINDLANIKNAEDVKKIAKKAFIEQEASGRKKFKPAAIVFIIIFAVNIFANVADVAFEAVDDAIDGFEEVVSVEFDDEEYIEDLYGVSEIEEDLYNKYDTIYDYLGSASVESAYLGGETGTLQIQLSEIGFEELSDNMVDETGTSLGEMYNTSYVALYKIRFLPEDVEDAITDENESVRDYAETVLLKGSLTTDGVLIIENVGLKLDEYIDECPYMYISEITVLSENESGEICYCGQISLSVDVIRINSKGVYEFYEITRDSDGCECLEEISSDETGFDFSDDMFVTEVIEF